MDHINLFSNATFSNVTSSNLTLTPLQKRIVMIAVAIFAVCATCFALFLHCRKVNAKKNIIDPPKATPVLIEKAINKDEVLKSSFSKEKEIIVPAINNAKPEDKEKEQETAEEQKKATIPAEQKEKPAERPKTPKEQQKIPAEETSTPTVNLEKQEPEKIAEITATTTPIILMEDSSQLTIDADLENKLPSFLSNLQQVAPTLAKAVTCTIGGVNYKLWWNFTHQAANVQKEQNFLSQKAIERQEGKIGIKEHHGKISYFIHNQPSDKGILPSQITLLKEILPEIEKMQKKDEELKDLKNKFDAKCLRLLLTFLKGPSGEQYRYQAPARTQSAKQLVLGSSEEILLWLRIEETSEDSIVMRRQMADIDASGTKNRYFINLQTKEYYQAKSKQNKLGIQLNEAGEIISVYKDSTPSDATAIFSPNEIWNKRLTEAIDHFLEKNALSYPNKQLALHALTLSQIPEKILALLCQDGTFEIPNQVNFLQDTLEKGVAIDAGGPKRQLLGELPLCLLDGSPTRVIKCNPETGLPRLFYPCEQREPEVLKNLGKMMSAALRSQGNFVIGRMLPDEFFNLLKVVAHLKAPLMEENVIEACSAIVSQDCAWMWDVWKTGRDLSDEEGDLIVNTLCLADKDLNPDFFDSLGELKKDSGKKILGDYLYGRYKGEVQAAHEIVQGLTYGHRLMLDNKPAVEISKSVQGESFSRDEIIKRVTCQTNDHVVKQKAEWLKELIQTQPEDWVLKLLKTVTGTSNVTAHTRIHLTPASGTLTCKAHTCFMSLDVPTEHVDHGTDEGANVDDKQKFLNNLELTMSESGFDDQ